MKFATWQGAAAQDARPAFDLIEPAAMGRNKLKIHVGMSFEPAVLFGLVSVEIVQDDVEPFAGVCGNQVIHEIQALTPTANLHTRPKGQTDWSMRELAKEQGVHPSTVARIWQRART